jgi:hypothetical protein
VANAGWGTFEWIGESSGEAEVDADVGCEALAGAAELGTDELGRDARVV